MTSTYYVLVKHFRSGYRAYEGILIESYVQPAVNRILSDSRYKELANREAGKLVFKTYVVKIIVKRIDSDGMHVERVINLSDYIDQGEQ